MNDVLPELHGGWSEGHLGVKKTLNKVWQRYYWLQARNDVEMWCRQCDTCAASRCPQTRKWSLMHHYVWDPFKRIVINVPRPFPRSDQGSLYLLIAMDYEYFLSGWRPKSLPIKRVRQWWKHWLPTSSAASEYCNSCIVTRAITLWVLSDTGFAALGSEQDAYHALAPAVGWHSGTLHQNGREAPKKGRHITPEGLGCKITHRPPCLQGIHPRHYGLDPG
jgi:hypothetical protein